MPLAKTTRKSAKKPRKSSASAKSTGLSAEEIAAMRETLKERKLAASKELAEQVALAAIAAMPEPDRSMGKRLHALIMAAAPTLSSRTWYGMPAYAIGDKVVCFFQGASKFKARYATLGFNDSARLDEGRMWATSFALKELTPADEARIAALVKKAVS